MTLGVSQKALENEYYMVDLPAILEDKAKEKNTGLLEQIMVRLATNSRYMPDDEYQKLMNQVFPKDAIPTENQFSREKFEELRMLTNMGVNRR
ncbi:hypothetical protein E1I69_20500 [Bacillus timonensis]|uniref:Uncharacterized protein n=1 Tax=Bacillus timonensis TaxID=1033734 RepID=A0A4S3PKG3_9BACI|nr:hypothetical protein [Bacillus timonensis]THE09950.1 hypothetical protein E1I69_20500 [Bacillus timonensis]